VLATVSTDWLIMVVGCFGLDGKANIAWRKAITRKVVV
jgi:hypothetical protein